MSYNGGLKAKTQLPQEIKAYWIFRGDMAVIDGVVMKGRHIVIQEALQQQVLKQLHMNHMDIEKTKLFEQKSVYWIGSSVDIETI